MHTVCGHIRPARQKGEVKPPLFLSAITTVGPSLEYLQKTFALNNKEAADGGRVCFPQEWESCLMIMLQWMAPILVHIQAALTGFNGFKKEKDLGSERRMQWRWV